MSRHQPTEICTNKSSCTIRTSRSKHREIARDAKEDVVLHYLSFDTSSKLTSESSVKENTYEFLRGNVITIGTESSQNTMNYDDDICKDLHVGKLHNSTVTLAVDGFDSVEKVTCAWKPVTITPQRRAFAKLRIVLGDSP